MVSRVVNLGALTSPSGSTVLAVAWVCHSGIAPFAELPSKPGSVQRPVERLAARGERRSSAVKVNAEQSAGGRTLPVHAVGEDQPAGVADASWLLDVNTLGDQARWCGWLFVQLGRYGIGDQRWGIAALWPSRRTGLLAAR